MPKTRRGSRRAETLARRLRVGRFIRERRLRLRLSQGDVQRKLGYRSVMSVADVELGRAGLPFKRIYQYADALQIPRDELVRFAIGEIQAVGTGGLRRPRLATQSAPQLTAVERQLLDDYRRLPTPDRNRIRAQLREFGSRPVRQHAARTRRTRNRR